MITLAATLRPTHLPLLFDAAVAGEAASIERGFVLHRIDLEKVRVLDARCTW